MEINDYLIYHFNPDPSKIRAEIAYVPLVRDFLRDNGPFKDVNEFLNIINAFGKGLLQQELVLQALDTLLKEQQNAQRETQQ